MAVFVDRRGPPLLRLHGYLLIFAILIAAARPADAYCRLSATCPAVDRLLGIYAMQGKPTMRLTIGSDTFTLDTGVKSLVADYAVNRIIDKANVLIDLLDAESGRDTVLVTQGSGVLIIKNGTFAGNWLRVQ